MSKIISTKEQEIQAELDKRMDERLRKDERVGISNKPKNQQKIR